MHVHPITNASIMGLKLEDLTFLKDTGHEPVLQSFKYLEINTLFWQTVFFLGTRIYFEVIYLCAF